MAEETPKKPTHLDDFKGSKKEQTAAKSEFISKYGFTEYEKLVQNSSITVKR
jgi:hypothetical protein